MIPISVFAGKHVAIFGLGRSGLAAGQALMAGGAIVRAWDDVAKSVDKAELEGLTIDDLYEADWSEISALVLSPGIPLTHPEPHPIVKLAMDAGVEIIGDIELFAREIAKIEKVSDRPKVVAVTGTNGKSTTTALIGHILQRCGLSVRIGGNIGRSVLDLAKPVPNSVYVIEMSSYQLDLTYSLKPDVAVFLNISPDHLERHGDFQSYIKSKQRIFACQDPDDLAVIGVDDEYSQETCTQVSAGLISGQPQRICPISVGKVLGHGMYVIDNVLYDGTIRPTTEVVNLTSAKGLPGQHNWQNAAAAYAASRHLFRNQMDIANAILSFPGLAHRLEPVGEVENLTFINDSKATNADACARGLAAFDNIFWIAGGRLKDPDLKALEPYFGRVKKAFLFGEAADQLAELLKGKVDFEKVGTIAKAVKLAGEQALTASRQKSELHGLSLNPHVVLFSPACASFDQYPNFEVRGDDYRDYVVKFIASRTDTDLDKKVSAG